MVAPTSDEAENAGDDLPLQEFVSHLTTSQGRIRAFVVSLMPGSLDVELSAENADTKSNEIFKELSRDICLHIAASSPSGLTRDDIDASVIEEEKDISRKQLIAEGKPEQIIDKILVGKINKFYSERCLVDQAFVKDDKVSITELLAAKSKELGDTVAIARYVRFSIGG
jgi:elongation factor Ts